MAFCSGLRDGCSVWPRPHTPEKAAGKAAITFQKQKKGLWPWWSSWSSTKTWLILPPAGGQCGQGREMLLKAGSRPPGRPQGGPPARCACSPGARCGAAESGALSRHRLRSSCTCSFCASPPRQWWSEMQKASKLKQKQKQNTEKPWCLLYRSQRKSTSGTQYPATCGVLTAGQKLNRDFGKWLIFQFQSKCRIYHGTAEALNMYKLKLKFSLLLLLLTAQSLNKNYV